MTRIGRAMAGDGARNRREHDFYPTAGGTTRAVMPLLQTLFPKKVWEPACGEGHMSRELLGAGFDVVSTDLVDRGYGSRMDFLTASRPLAEAIVTNPPFRLTRLFIEHAITILDIQDIALVLPLNYWSAANRTDLFHRFRPSFVLPMTWRLDSTGEGRPTMSFMWCIWARAVPAEPWTRFLPMTSSEKKPGQIDPLW